jgi:hypothetical protein
MHNEITIDLSAFESTIESALNSDYFEIIGQGIVAVLLFGLSKFLSLRVDLGKE